MLKTPLLLLAGGGLAALGASGCGASSSASTDHHPAKKPVAQAASAGPVAVNLDEWAVKPTARVVKAGRVTFTARNTGKTEHEMVVVRTSKPAADLGSGSRVSEKGSAGEIIELKAGRSGKVTLNLKPGHYALICNVPGHYKAGMHTDLIVK